jgi:PAS domain S-box-containing protein
VPSTSVSNPLHAAARLAGLLDSAMDAIISVDEAQTIVLYNRAAEKIFGWPTEQVLGQPIAMLLPERFQPVHAGHVKRFADTGVTSRRMSGATVVYGRRSSGEEFPVEASISQVDTPEGKLFTVILRDVTARVQAEQEQSRLAARLAGLLESAMDAIISVDEAQNVVLYNRAAEKIFGWPTEQAMGKPLEMLLPERFQSAHAGHVKRFADTGVTSRRMSGATVVYGRRSSGEEFPVEASISQVDTPEGKLFTVILRDVTARVRSEQDQSRLAARLAGLLDSAMDAIITTDDQQRIVLYNQAAERTFGWSATEVMGSSLDVLMPERYRSSHTAHVRRFATVGVSSRRMGDGTVIHGLRKSGEEFPMEASISQLDIPEGKLFTVILRDVTERIRAQEDLAAFASEASAIREQEKSRVARELHDELAQSLTALKMDTIWVRENLGADALVIDRKLGEMLSMLDGSVAATRRIAADLRPLVLDDLGLMPAIEWLVQNFTQRTGIACELDADEELELHEPYATAVFRIVQESLVNVAKHSKAKRVKVVMDLAGREMLLSVQDDGVGFAPAAGRKPNSLGLAGLRERAQLLKGTIRLQSQPGRGTTVEARIPVIDTGAGS